MNSGVLVCMIARIPEAGVASFRRYEAAVLPLLTAYGGVLERRVADAGGTFEVHLVRFPSQEALERFRCAPQRAEAATLLRESGATTEAVLVADL